MFNLVRHAKKRHARLADEGGWCHTHRRAPRGEKRHQCEKCNINLSHSTSTMPTKNVWVKQVRIMIVSSVHSGQIEQREVPDR